MRPVALLLAIASVSSLFAAEQTTADLSNRTNTDNVPVESMGLDRPNFSPLKEITRSNVTRLSPVWSVNLMNDAGELAAPVVFDGVMYLMNGRFTSAIDVGTGRLIWRTPVAIDPGAYGVAPFGAITRGAPAIYHGKLFRISLDNRLIALDMKTGNELWSQTFADWREGYTATGAPIVANGIVISGVAGGEFTTRGFLDGWDPDTGKKLWRRYTVPAPGEPGSETWPKDNDTWKIGGGSTWRSGSYDPELDLVYWGTGNAQPYDPRPRGELDSLFTASVIALRPKTGELVCHFQYTPNDVYDVDANDEHVLADLQIAGRLRKVMIQPNKNGFLYVLDRTSCALIAAHPYTTVNWAERIDLATGRPVLTDLYQRFLAGEEVSIYPQRGTNAVPIAFDAGTATAYISAWNLPRIQRLAPPQPPVLGSVATGVLGRAGFVSPGDVVGHYVAMDVLTGATKWKVPLRDRPGSAGMLATAGGLVFTGTLTGELIALDADTGNQLWQFQTGSSVNSTAITYTYKGRQHVTVASGVGGQWARRFAPSDTPPVGSVWTFALTQP